uniref:Matrix protein n=2 Tax=Ekpoma virus TaxID=1615798 RepID=A0A2S1ZNT6_9RHAB|nr:M protein [Ekpoma virus]
MKVRNTVLSKKKTTEIMISKWKPKKQTNQGAPGGFSPYFMATCPDPDWDIVSTGESSNPIVDKSYVTTSTLVLTTNKPLKSMESLYSHMESFQDENQLSMIIKSFVGLNMALLYTHLTANNNTITTSGPYTYSANLDTVISYPIKSGIPVLKTEKTEIITLNTREMGQALSSRVKVTLKPTKRTGRKFEDIYKVPMSNGTNPPDIQLILRKLGMENSISNGAVQLDMYT